MNQSRRCLSSQSALLAFFWILTFAAIGHAQYEQKQGPATLHVEGDKADGQRVEIRLSSVLHVAVSVEGPATLEVEKPGAITNSKFWQVRQSSEPEFVELPAGRRRWEQAFQIEPENKGELPLQVAPLRYRPEKDKGEWQTANWKEFTVHVTTTVAKIDPSEARPITGPEAVPEASSPWSGILRWTGIGFIALFVMLLALELKRRLRPPQPELPPHEWAERELARLDSLGLPEHGQAERYHTLVSDTIRRYLELRFELRAPRQTTAEFLDAMRQSPKLTPDQRSLLRDFLERCDLAKFARAEYSVEECQKTAAMARSFIEQTKPAPEPPVAAEVKPA